MITIRQVNLPDGPAFAALQQHPYYNAAEKTFSIPHQDDQVIEGKALTLFPGLIDPHVHFRTPGQEYKEDWRTAALAALRGGYSTVFDMPNNIPACVSFARLQEKKSLIEQQLGEVGAPLRYELYIGADKNHFDELVKVKPAVIAVKVFMGSSTGDLLMDDASSLHAIFSLAAHHDMLVALHAEDEEMICQRQQQFAGQSGHHLHSQIRTPEVAAAAIKQVAELCRLYGARAYVLHVSSIQELEVLAAAKREGLTIYAETSPHHLFLNDQAYAELGAKVQMNPPLRSPEHQPALFEAIANNIIDTVGSDHAPHTLDEKDQPYPDSPSGVPGVETNLPLLLNARHQGKLTLEQIASLSCRRVQTMFNYHDNRDDLLLVDLNETRTVSNSDLKTKCGWSPFAGWTLTGWPVYSLVNNQFLTLNQLG
ncbi:MAG: amidohydrolase family protein [Gammaproteobacteria bacterium]|nr:amidohydrolase family protein [Gammaproteobacteria bacterium]